MPVSVVAHTLDDDQAEGRQSESKRHPYGFQERKRTAFFFLGRFDGSEVIGCRGSLFSEHVLVNSAHSLRQYVLHMLCRWWNNSAKMMQLRQKIATEA